MPPKRQAKANTPPPKKKVKKTATPAQPSIDSFFSSPNKPRVNGIKPRQSSVISIPDSDDDLPQVKRFASPPRPAAHAKRSPSEERQIDRDQELARRLEQQWADDPKGKKRAVHGEVTEDRQDEIVEVLPASPPGINGSSSSSLKLPGKEVKVEDEKPLAAIFTNRPASPPRSPKLERYGSPTTPKLDEVDIKPAVPSTPKGLIAKTTEAAEPIDFDTDAFLFRPAEIDTASWPKGRLPYSVLVGVYVQVSSTRSRLIIVRVLTK